MSSQSQERNGAESLTVSLGTSPDGREVRLALGVESAGAAGMHCAITRWWPGADEHTGLLTLIATSLSASRPSGDLDIVVSRQPQPRRQPEFAFPHTKVPIERLRRWRDDLMEQRRRIRRDGESIEDGRRRGRAVPHTLLIVDLPDHATLAYLGGQVLNCAQVGGIFTIVTMSDELLPTSDRYGTGPTVPPDWVGRFIGAAVQMSWEGGQLPWPQSPGPELDWATLYTWHPPFQSGKSPESPAARVKSQDFQIAAAASA